MSKVSSAVNSGFIDRSIILQIVSNEKYPITSCDFKRGVDAFEFARAVSSAPALRNSQVNPSPTFFEKPASSCRGLGFASTSPRAFARYAKGPAEGNLASAGRA